MLKTYKAWSVKKYEKALANQLIGLSKEIILPPIPQKYTSSVHSFIGGDGKKKVECGGVPWAITEKGYVKLNEIASNLRKNYNQLNYNREELTNVILDFLKFNCFNKDLFCIHKIIFDKSITSPKLFDCSVYKDIKKFGQELKEKLLEYLNKEFMDCIILYPLYRIQTEENVFTGNFQLVKSSSKEYWNELSDDFDSLRIFNPQQGKIGPQSFQYTDLWLIYHTKLNPQLNKKYIVKKLRMFFAILVSEIYKKNKHIIYKSMESPCLGYFIFMKDSQIFQIETNHLMHSFLGEIVLDEISCKDIMETINKIDNLKGAALNRFELFCDYLIRGINEDKEDRIIDIFIALDALWGEQGKSEATTTSGICSVLGNDCKSKEKSKKLYNLRCELLHGGASVLEEWKYYDYYCDKFNSSPENDLLDIALKYIIKYNKSLPTL